MEITSLHYAPENLVADIETNGLLDEVTTLHCISIQSVDAEGNPLETVHSYNDHGTGEGTLAEGLARLQRAALIIGHNWLGYDHQVLKKLYPSYTPVGIVRDTMILSTILYGDLKDRDFKTRKKLGDAFPGQMIGRHSLEAWGYRLGKWKGDYAQMMKDRGLDPWAEWSQEMDDYCDQDVEVTAELWRRLLKRGMPEDAIELEQGVAPILARQTKHGFLFDAEAARRLEIKLIARRAALEAELAALVEPWQRVKKTFIPKANNKKLGYVKGVEVTVYETVVFNPRSDSHVADRLKTLYGWEPMEFTPTGLPKVDEDILGGLKYPIIPQLLEHAIVTKRLGQLSEGKEAWFVHVKKDGRIHGSVNQNAAVTGRMTHSKPNMAQVPKCGVPYGEECRALFIVPPGKKLVGADASGLELRCLAHYMARHDDGAYAKVLLEGDIHSENQKAAGLPTRDNAKTFIYAFLYGAGDHKLGTIVGKGRMAGTMLRKRFLNGLPALKKLSEGVKKRAKERGYLMGLDCRQLHVRSDHAALNTLLQSAGALVMKRALVILDNMLQAKGYIPGGVNYEFVGNIHDEWQIECDESIAEDVGQTATLAIAKAGDYFGFRCPLAGEYKVGNNWSETH